MSPGRSPGLELMTLSGVLAQVPVTDVEAAEGWYRVLFDRGPDARPMNGLLEWYVTRGATPSGLQVWRDAGRAGTSTAVLSSDDLIGLAARLTAAGVVHGGPEPGGGARLLQLADPDGNRVVITGL